jgi:hypothetical protein
MSRRLVISGLYLLCLAGTIAAAPEASAQGGWRSIFGSKKAVEKEVPKAAAGSAQGMVPVTGNPGADIDASLSLFLSQAGDSKLLLPHRLDKSKLDFSVKSLEVIDDWLDSIHVINKLEVGEGKAGGLFVSDGRGDNSVTFAGLYLGEVVRQNAKDQTWVWQSFDVFKQKNPMHATQLEGEAGFDEYVLVSPQGVAMPGNAALKRVLNGKIDSLAFIGAFLIEPLDVEAALKGNDMTGLPPMSSPPAVDPGVSP